MSQGTKFLDRVNGPMHGKASRTRSRPVKDATHCQPVSRSALALSCAAVAARWASSISVRAMAVAQARPPLKPAPTRSSMMPAASLGCSPSATARIRADFIAAVASRDSGRDSAVIWRVVRLTIASSAGVKTVKGDLRASACPAGKLRRQCRAQ